MDVVPRPRRRAIEIGCGEGRVTRDLKERGHDVVGVDVAPTMVRLAREADPGGAYVQADAASLPFEPGSFDLAVAFNSLMDVDDMTASRDGLEVEIRSRAYPLEAYAQALEDVGLLIELVREPPDPDRPVPNFLVIRAVKRH